MDFKSELIEILSEHVTSVKHYNITLKNISYPNKKSYADMADFLESEMSAQGKEMLKFMPPEALSEAIESVRLIVKNNVEEAVVRDISDKYEVYSIEDSDDKNGYVVYNIEKDSFNTTTFHHLQRMYSAKELGTIPRFTANIIYDPSIKSNSERVKDSGHEDEKVINMFEHPSWREKFNTRSSNKALCDLPTLAREFLEHLFPEEKSRFYVYEWVYHALTNPKGNLFILVLQGVSGNGKTFFTDVLLKALFGKDTKAWHRLSNSGLGQFQSGWKNRRIIVLDEFRVNREKAETMKQMTNDVINLEFKGKDADTEYDKHYSIVTTTNVQSNWYINSDDRRSSIVDITSTKLEEVWGQEKRDKFEELLKEEGDFVYEIGAFFLTRSWIEEEEKEIPELRQFEKTDKFFDFVYEGLSAWERDLLDGILNTAEEDDVYNISGFCRKVSQKKGYKDPLSEKLAANFINSYRHHGEKLGEVYRDNGEVGLPVVKVKINKRILKKKEVEDLL